MACLVHRRVKENDPNAPRRVALLEDVRACGPSRQLSADRCQRSRQPFVEMVRNDGRCDPRCRRKHRPELGALSAFLTTSSSGSSFNQSMFSGLPREMEIWGKTRFIESNSSLAQGFPRAGTVGIMGFWDGRVACPVSQVI